MDEKEIIKEVKSLSRIKELLAEKRGEREAEAIILDSERRIRNAWKNYEGVTKEEAYHLKKIIPIASAYLSIKETHPDMALAIVLQSHRERANVAAVYLQKAVKLPGMKGLFMKMWKPLTVKMFGEKAGFKNVFYETDKNEFRMDIIQCPYCKAFAELGAPELAKYSCESDDIVYGNLEGIDFIRTQTLATGGSKCDFYLKLADK